MKHDTHTKVRHTFKLTSADIVGLLRGTNPLPLRPDSEAKVTIIVPSGGDWSGMTVNVDDCGGVVVTWMEGS